MVKESTFSKFNPTDYCRTLLVAGQHGTGKTRTLMSEIDTSEHKEVLWLATDNARGVDNFADTWYYEYLTNRDDYIKVYNKIVTYKGKLDYVVLDSLDGLIRMILNDARDSTKPIGMLTQSDYLIVGDSLIAGLKGLFKHTNNLFCSVNIVRTNQGDLSIAVNRDFYNKGLSIFTDRWVCQSKTIKGEAKYNVNKSLYKLSDYSPR